jgi:hypothetical protein
MTETILVALVALITALFANALLTPSSRPAAQACLRAQLPGRQTPRASQFGI